MLLKPMSEPQKIVGPWKVVLTNKGWVVEGPPFPLNPNLPSLICSVPLAYNARAIAKVPDMVEMVDFIRKVADIMGDSPMGQTAREILERVGEEAEEGRDGIHDHRSR